MGKFIEVQVHARDTNILLNSDYIVSVREVGARTSIKLNNTVFLPGSYPIRTDEIEVDDPYDVIKYKLIKEDVH